MRTSEKGIAFIKKNEGFVSHVYNDNGKQAIGYGHDLLPGESYPDGISMEQADSLLRTDLLTRYEPAVSNVVSPREVTQGQWDALVDFCYNLGPANLATMLAHGWDQVPVQMPRWADVNHELNEGLLARRQAEVEMWKE